MVQQQAVVRRHYGHEIADEHLVRCQLEIGCITHLGGIFLDFEFIHPVVSRVVKLFFGCDDIVEIRVANYRVQARVGYRVLIPVVYFYANPFGQ